MRVAALYDIHGNLPALEAVLAEIHDAVDLVVVGGDVFPGPMSIEALDLLQTLEMPVRFIHGNGERAMLALASGQDVPGVPEQHLPAMRWVASRLAPGQQRLLAAWPSTVPLEIAGMGTVLFCHATPRNDTEIFTRETPADRLAPVLAGVAASLVICGHTHMQFDRTVGGVRVVNAGSVGMPFGEPGAYWLRLGPDVQLCRTHYDLDAAAARIRASGYPQAGDFAEKTLRPPSEREMLDRFAHAELR